jgi:hypothetical protein
MERVRELRIQAELLRDIADRSPDYHEIADRLRQIAHECERVASSLAERLAVQKDC